MSDREGTELEVLRERVSELEEELQARFRQGRPAGAGEPGERQPPSRDDPWSGLNSLLSNLPCMAYRCRNDPWWTMESLSAGCFDLTGYHPTDLIGNRTIRFGDLIHPDDREPVWEQVQYALERKTHYELQYRIRTAANQEKWVWDKGIGVFSEQGVLLELEGLISDITDTKQAEQRLKESEARYRGIVEDDTDFIVRWLPDGSLTFVNEAYCRHLGQTREQLIGGSRFDVTGEDYHPALRDKFGCLTPEQPVAVDERRVLGPGGRVTWQQWTDRGIFDDCGRLVELQSIGRDITERKEAEERLKESEARYRSVVEDQTDFIVRWLPDGTRTFVNEAHCRHLGQTREQLIGGSRFDVIGEEYHPALREKIAGLTPEQPVAVDERRVVGPDGRVTWEQWTDRGVFDEEGRLTELQSIGRDVPERKEAEERLKESEARYRTLVEYATEAIVVFDAKSGRFADANEQAGTLYGLDREALLQVGPVELSPERQPDGRLSSELAWQRIQEALAGQTPTFEWMHRNAAGTDIPCEIRLVRLPAAGRELIRASVTDISERKRQEEAWHNIAKGVSATTGKRFFRSLVVHLAKALGADYVFIAELVKERSGRVRSIAFFANGAIGGDFDYELAGTPWEKVVRKRPCICPRGVRRTFPRDRLLAELAAEGLIATPLFNAAGRALGLLVALYRRPVRAPKLAAWMLQIFAARAAAELERRVVEQSLRESEERYRAFVIQSSEAIWRLEFDRPLPVDLPEDQQIDHLYQYGYYAECNDAFAHLYSMSSAGQMVGERLSQWMPRSDPDNIEQLRTFIRSGYRLADVETHEVDSEGRPKCFLSNALGIVENGALQRVWGTQRDISDRKRAEEQLRKLNEKLRQRNKELDEFNHLSSHDLQEPLRHLVLFSQCLERHVGAELSPEARHDLEMIKRAARRMRQNILAVQSLGRVGRARLKQESVSLKGCLRRALENLTARLNETGASISAADLPEVVGDEALLTSLFQNLIENALKYNSGQPPVVQVTCEPSDNRWVVGVRDNGMGIEAEYAETVFRPFERLHSGERYEGSGIGLALCRTVVERHEGRIWVESNPGLGSHFKFTLPYPRMPPGLRFSSAAGSPPGDGENSESVPAQPDGEP